MSNVCLSIQEDRPATWLRIYAHALEEGVGTPSPQENYIMRKSTNVAFSSAQKAHSLELPSLHSIPCCASFTPGSVVAKHFVLREQRRVVEWNGSPCTTLKINHRRRTQTGAFVAGGRAENRTVLQHGEVGICFGRIGIGSYRLISAHNRLNIGSHLPFRLPSGSYRLKIGSHLSQF